MKHLAPLAGLIVLTMASGPVLASPTGDELAERPASVRGVRATLPMSSTFGMPTLMLRINGKGPFRVAFDTGALGGPFMTPRLVEALRIMPTGVGSASDPTGRNPVSTKTYHLASVAFGDVLVRGWDAESGPANHGKLETIDAVMGLAAFDGYVVTLDYAHHQFSVRRGALPTPDGRTVFAYEGPIPVAPLSVEGHVVQAHIDTGNIFHAVVVPEGLALVLSGKSEAKAIGAAHTVSNTIQMFQIPTPAPPAIGDAVLDAHDVAYPTVAALANVGSLALDRLVLRVDPANHRIALN